MKKAPMLVTCMAVVIAAAILLSEKPQERNEGTTSPSSAVSMSDYSTANTPSSQENSGAAPTAGIGSGYLVREYQGHIGVYRVGENTPFREYETEVDMLPDADRQALKRGKPAATMAEVEKIIEDYDG